ncbi:MAG TPA: phenylalanine--tRNA ligase subunit beta [Terriglobales bacterium]|nr:phenylalanine--tRNA ligase subunit beta [Terriglobales bacterium]
MKLLPTWIRDFVDLKVDNATLAHDLTSIGIAVEGISGEGDSTVFEMEIGTNRPDAMNHYGVAREASAFYDLALKPYAAKLPPFTDLAGMTITVEDGRYCPRFTARVVRDVTIKASPAKITQRLGLLDQRPINNAVDATNYVLWESGKPTHVFDLDLLEGRRIVVRFARAGETLKTLDGVVHKLTTEDLVVCDAKKPVGLAGVMGGYDTMITERTRNILIESAWWDPPTVRKMSKRHGLHTDASHRFERGADYESTLVSTNRVAELILSSAGGTLVGDAIDVVVGQRDQAPIVLNMSEVHRILGKDLSAQEVVRILSRLGFETTPGRQEGEEFEVTIPSWRLDVEREIDVIEEIARLYGYDRFPNTLPAFTGAVIEPPDAPKDAKLRNSLLGLGYDEAVSLNFISAEDAKTFSHAPSMTLANPLSEQASVMRTSLLPGMLDMLAYNLNRGTDDVRLFEAGHVYEADGAGAAEPKQICFAATGSALPVNVNRPSETRSMSFYDVKGDVENLLSSFASKTLHYDTEVAGYFHPGRAARAVLDGTVVAQLGQLHPDVAGARKLRQDVFVAEMFLGPLYEHELREPRYQALPRYPAVERDFSFVFADGVVFEQIERAINKLKLSELRSFAPAEIFRGGNVPAGKYSILLRAVFQSNERTLREDEVAQWSGQIIKALEGLGGVLRA